MDIDWSKKVIPFVVFFLVAHPETFKMTRSVLGSWVGNTDGVPTNMGLLLHALVFVLLATFAWRMVYGKKVTKYEPSPITEECM